MDECQHELDFEELEQLCRNATDEELSAEEEEGGEEGETGGEEGGGVEGRDRAMGQSESKKASKKAAATADGLHTKGTAMSFGFKKHKVHQATGTINGTAGRAKLPVGDAGSTTETTVPGAVANQVKKFNANGNTLPGGTLEREKAERELVQATVISNPGVDAVFRDKNGNTGSLESVDDTGGGGGTGAGRYSSTGRTTPRLQPPRKDSHGAPYRSNRFGFRTNNVVRPASVGLQPRVANGDFDKYSPNNINNNNIHTNNNNNNSNVYVVADKRRSKSASSAASARTTFTPLPVATAAAAAVPYESAGTGHSMALHQHAYGGCASALHRPSPKYHPAPNTKITQPKNDAPDSNATDGGGVVGSYQQAVAKGAQGEHKNTPHSALTHRQPSQPHQYTPANEGGQSALASASGGLHAKPPPHAGSDATGPKLGQEAVASKFTLHSSSLPKPQYPVSISLAGSTSGPVASARYTMDTKGAKHAVNVSRKEFASTSAAGAPALEDTTTATTSSIRMPRQRYRNLEMVMSGRHKFEVRDLEALTTEPIVPLPLPELPSAFGSTVNQRTAPLSGLIRSTELAASANVTAFDDDIDINDNRYELAGAEREEGDDHTDRTGATYVIDRRKGPGGGLLDSTTTQCPSDGESFEEEKLLRDNNSSEKSLKGALIKELAEHSVGSKTSSPGSSRTSWCNAGEALASKDFGSFSLSSSDESRSGAGKNAPREQPPPSHADVDEEDVSSVTITAGNPSVFSSISGPVPMDVSTNLDSVSEVQISFTDPGTDPLVSGEADIPDRMFRNEQSRFAEMAAAISDVLLLDDETSPTDSLVSSCTENSDDVKKLRHSKKTAENTKEKEKDIDEISPELDELTSPVSPGTPTHASNSLSLSDGGRDFLIDDEIADQPGLVFDEGSTLDLGSLNLNLASQNTDTPTLQEPHNNRPPAAGAGPPAAPKAAHHAPKPRKVLPDAYESPALSRKSTRSGNRLMRAESLDTLSPCDSIASDDFMLDLDYNSSMDSIDRFARSSVGGSATGLHSMDELQLWSELENKGGHIIREWSSLLRSNPISMSNSINNNHQSGHNTSRESITSQLPARARLLTRRLQNNATPTNGSESPRSMDSLPRRTFSGAYRTATLSQFANLANNNSSSVCADAGSTATNSAEDLTLLDKSLRNSMLQDVVHFKKQLVRLRRILQEDEENLMMTDTLNPFENNNGQFFTTAAAANNGSSGGAGAGPASNGVQDSNKQQENGVFLRESGVAALALLEDQRHELADLRRQVVYLQGEVTAKDRTIRQQQNLIEKYEAEREKQLRREGSSNGGTAEATGGGGAPGPSDANANGERSHSESISTATQTERLRPVSFGGQEGLGSRNEPPTAPKNGLRTPTAANSSSSSTTTNTSTTTTHQQPIGNGLAASGHRSPASKTQISSVYTQLSSVRHSIAGGSAPSTPAGSTAPAALRRTSLGSAQNLSSFGLHGSGGPSSSSGSKSVRTTHIGTLAATGRQHTSGDRIPVLVNGTAKQPKGTPARAPPNGGVPPGPPSKLNGLNGATKRTVANVIRPPSSFGGSIVPADAQQALLKSKSAPATPLSASGKLLTAPATGNATHPSLANGHDPSPRGSACDGNDTLQLLPNVGPSGCSDAGSLSSAASAANGIVGH